MYGHIDQGGLMEESKKGIKDFNDKYKKEAGREAFQEEDETKFLDKEALDNDLTDIPDVGRGDHGQIVTSGHPENQEWNVREEQNRDNP